MRLIVCAYIHSKEYIEQRSIHTIFICWIPKCMRATCSAFVKFFSIASYYYCYIFFFSCVACFVAVFQNLLLLAMATSIQNYKETGIFFLLLLLFISFQDLKSLLSLYTFFSLLLFNSLLFWIRTYCNGINCCVILILFWWAK